MPNSTMSTTMSNPESTCSPASLAMIAMAPPLTAMTPITTTIGSSAVFGLRVVDVGRRVTGDAVAQLAALKLGGDEGAELLDRCLVLVLQLLVAEVAGQRHRDELDRPVGGDGRRPGQRLGDVDDALGRDRLRQRGD